MSESHESSANVEDVTYAVVRNDEEQYSIWPAARALPAGWLADGFTGSREQCLARIEEVWTDIRPKSARVPRGDEAESA